MRRIFITCIIACLAIAWLSSQGVGQQGEIPPGTTGDQILEAQKVKMVTPAEDRMLFSVDKSDRIFTRIENTLLKRVSFFHKRKIGDAIVEKDFIRYKFDTETGNLIEKTVNWRDDLPEEVIPAITKARAESMVEGEPQWSRLYFISPESEIYRIDPTPQNPCWVVRSIENERHIVTIIDAMTGEKLGYGIPPPSEGMSIHGPDHPPNCDNDNPLWSNHAQNAHDWFETMGYDTIKSGSATGLSIQWYIQSDDGVMFYELDHGGSTSFKNRCDDNILGTEVETWITNYASMGFAFIGSCLGLCDTGEDTFAEEFRKGQNEDTVVVGYCGMSWDECDDCWGDAIAWQTEMFEWMNDGWTIATAFSEANLDFPDCTDDSHNCMRIIGDTSLRFAGDVPFTTNSVPNIKRSNCGVIRDFELFGVYHSPLRPVREKWYTRAHHIRCDSVVPSGDILTIRAYGDFKYNEIVFLNNSRITAFGTGVLGYPYSLKAYVSVAGGEVTFVSEADRNKGLKIMNTGALKAINGGKIKVYE